MFNCNSVNAKYCNSLETNLNGNYMRTFMCSDKNTYVVKFFYPQIGERILPNEYIIGALAKYLELPCYDISFVEVDKELLDEENLGFYSEGKQLGILYDEHADELRERRIKNINNVNDIAKILVFDQWIYNLDRGAEYSNWLINDNLGGKLHIIDHSEAFGRRDWSKTTLDLSLETPVPFTKREMVYKLLYARLQEEFEEPINIIDSFIEEIKGIPTVFIEDIVNSVPVEWNINISEKQQVVNYLIERRKSLQEIFYSGANTIFEKVG
jgi:hypothetical protein